MSAELAAAVARVWPGGVDAWEILGGGITNHNLKVTLGTETLVLRVAGRDTGLLGIDRGDEKIATETAHAAGVGPEVVRFVEPEGWLVTRFIPGPTPPPTQLRRPAGLRAVAAALRAIHTGPAIPGRFETIEVVESYRDTALARGAVLPEAFARSHERARAIAARRAAAPRVACHNDLLNANFILEGESLHIVDWEYAGMGDPCFDLANFSINHELSRSDRLDLLRAYREAEPSDEDAAALELMRFMSDFREAMWGVVQRVVSTLDFDFAAYADEHFERMERTAAEPGFQAALGR